MRQPFPRALEFSIKGSVLSTRAEQLLIDPSCASFDAALPWPPLGFVDLRTWPARASLEVLPPFPLIGLGDPAHPLASLLDSVVEPPVSAEALIRQVTRVPHAAALTVQLLRSIEGVPPARALTLESVCYGLLQGSAEHAAWLRSRVPIPRAAPAGTLLVERHDSVLNVTLNRPLAHNAIDRGLRDQLFEAFTLAAFDPDIRTVKLRATGRAFSMGGDLDEFGSSRDPAQSHLIRSRTLPILALADRTHLLSAHVQGACVGAGLELAAFASRLTADADAWFQLPELSMGLIPGAGGCVSVPRRIGRHRAALMILSGRRIDAATALRWGLIDAIEDDPR